MKMGASPNFITLVCMDCEISFHETHCWVCAEPGKQLAEVPEKLRFQFAMQNGYYYRASEVYLERPNQRGGTDGTRVDG